MLHDIRYSARLLARRPGFTAVALLSLALGLGGASVTFGLVDGLVLKPFAYPEPLAPRHHWRQFPEDGR